MLIFSTIRWAQVSNRERLQALRDAIVNLIHYRNSSLASARFKNSTEAARRREIWAFAPLTAEKPHQSLCNSLAV